MTSLNRQPSMLVNPQQVARRWFLRDCGLGLGTVALHQLLGSSVSAATSAAGEHRNPLAPKKSHIAAKAKRVIYLFMAGAPSQLELFDHKPELIKHDGTLPPAELLKNYRAAFIDPNSRLMGTRFPFKPAGKSGAQISELLPQTAKVVDDITIVKSMFTEAINHAPGQIMMNTGSQQFGRPSLGAWTLYGLGSEADNLPGFVVLSSGMKGPSGGNSNWGSGFLPTIYQGVTFRSSGDPVLYLSNPPEIDSATQADTIATLRRLNTQRLAAVGDPEIATRINSFEIAYKMQSSAPELMELSQESQATLDMYGAQPGKASFANNCLLARRLIERGVRFVQLFHEAWDQHDNLKKELVENCQDTDRAAAALVQDLKQRGLLEDTIVVWGGEFGRTPMVQGEIGDGRDHHPNAFSMWFAGGGFKSGAVVGRTDDLGFNAVENPIHINDLHATILHLLGFDHTKLTYRFQGRDFRLTDVAGEIQRQLLA